MGLVFDHAGGSEFVDFVGVLGPWGTLVTYNAFAPLPDPTLVSALREHMAACPSVRAFSFHRYDHDREARRALMREVIRALADGEIRPAAFARLPLSEVRRAHELLESGAALGKIVMVPSTAGSPPSPPRASSDDRDRPASLAGRWRRAAGATARPCARGAVTPRFINMLSWATLSLIRDGDSQSAIRPV